MILNFLLLAVCGSSSFADAPVLAKDPLCNDSPEFFREELAKARPLHMKYPQLRVAADSQTKWFMAVSKDMKNICEADAKFALEMTKKDRSELSGQCKPAAEAALADQEVLEHSEQAIRTLKTKKKEYILDGVKNGPDALINIFEKDFYRVDVDALDLGDVPRAAACELYWIYPQVFFKNKVPFIGCTEAPPGVKLSDWDKKNPGVLAQMMTRFDLSLDYNTARRDNARATAAASKARYETCVQEHPGTENVLVKNAAAVGSGKSAPAGKKSKSNTSDITGVDENKKKEEKK